MVHPNNYCFEIFNIRFPTIINLRAFTIQSDLNFRDFLKDKFTLEMSANISTFVDQTHIQHTHLRRKRIFQN